MEDYYLICLDMEEALRNSPFYDPDDTALDDWEPIHKASPIDIERDFW